MEDRQRKRIFRRKQRRRRRIRRKIRMWMFRILAAAFLFLMVVFVGKGGSFLWKQLVKAWKTEETIFFGARSIDTGEKKPGVPRIVLDAGHGGKDQGTCSGDILEKDINLAVVEKLAGALEKNGAEVVLTREDDRKIGLEERAAFANERDADYFISIHCNFCESDAEVRGLECYYREGSAGSESLAESIVRKMNEEEKVECRGTRTANYRVLRKTSMPAVLVELGYFSNYAECSLLAGEDYQELLADRIAEGISDAFHPAP